MGSFATPYEFEDCLFPLQKESAGNRDADTENRLVDTAGEGESKERRVKSLSRVQLCDPCSVAFHAGQSMEFSRQEYWGGLPFPSPGDLPDSGIKPRSPALQAGSLLAEPQGKLLDKDSKQFVK